MWFSSFFILIAISTLSSLLVFQAQKETDSIKSFLGKEVVFAKDTLTIIDYSSFKSTYTLSDGKEYEINLIQSRILK